MILITISALVSDIWDAGNRGEALAFFALAPLTGLTLGPIVSGFMSVQGVSWRWLYWLLMFFAGICLILISSTLPEAFVMHLMARKAERSRKETGNDRYWAAMAKQKSSIGQHLKHVLARPFIALFREPMLMATTLCMSFVYGCMDLLFEAYSVVFLEGHNLSMGLFGLTFLPIFLGGCTDYPLIFNTRYVRSQKKHAPHPVLPEKRLEVAMFAARMFMASFFWFGWTSYPSISLWAALIAGYPLGWSIVWIFLALFNYVADAYLFVAASALASLTVVRSCFGAGFPMFATQMFERLNSRWASTLLGFIALLMAPIPFVLFKYGPIIRKKSKYAPTKPMPVPVKEMTQADPANHA
ncbi:MFS general substrate transporter [Laetiporus sulphureus 93-53]|uniref:MFS general substrate transporter n=1 Tax=Laetiporus sulphureus 93-53 TaxID=1314785 RepID=A0A165D2S8_9APHY|nr:MFS general substrate transporter [Laetiporus sulphureus 93-53]KZT04045.1 MFS general substrate transporter [Laetiporus sulphureus 93-53]